MHADGQFDCAIAPAKEGTVQDVQWGPGGSNKGNKFVVIAGSMPSTSTLYNIKVRRGGRWVSAASEAWFYFVRSRVSSPKMMVPYACGCGRPAGASVQQMGSERYFVDHTVHFRHRPRALG